MALRSSCRLVLTTSSGCVTSVVIKKEPDAASILPGANAREASGRTARARRCARRCALRGAGVLDAHLSPNETTETELTVIMALAA